MYNFVQLINFGCAILLSR